MAWHRDRRVVDDLVLSRAPLLKREVEITSFDLEAKHLLLEQTDGLEKQLLAGLVTVQHDHG